MLEPNQLELFVCPVKCSLLLQDVDGAEFDCVMEKEKLIVVDHKIGWVNPNSPTEGQAIRTIFTVTGSEAFWVGIKGLNLLCVGEEVAAIFVHHGVGRISALCHSGVKIRYWAIPV